MTELSEEGLSVHYSGSFACDFADFPLHRLIWSFAKGICACSWAKWNRTRKVWTIAFKRIWDHFMHTNFCFYWRVFSLVHVCKAAFALPCLPSWSGPLGGAEFLQDRYSRKCCRWRDDDDNDVWWMMCDVWWWMMTWNRDWHMFLGPLFTARRFWFPWFRQPWVSPSVVARRMIQTDQHSKRITWPFTSTSAAPKRALKLNHWKSVFFFRKHEECHDRFFAAEKSEHVKFWQYLLLQQGAYDIKLRWSSCVSKYFHHRPRYYRRAMNFKSYGVESAEELVDLVKDAAWNLRNSVFGLSWPKTYHACFTLFPWILSHHKRLELM